VHNPPSVTAAKHNDNSNTNDNNGHGHHNREKGVNEGGDVKREAQLYDTDPSPSRITVIEPKGTLALMVGREHHMRRLIVSSNIKRLNPKWQAVVARRYPSPLVLLRLLLMAHSTREGFKGKRQIRLPDDDADMMLVLMWIVHFRFSEVPMTLDFSQLLAVTRICKRYDMNEIVNPFVVGWMTLHQISFLKVGYEQWLYIAYQFGMEDVYARLTRDLAVDCRINANKQLLVRGTDQVLDGLFPDETLCKCAS
jgi:hypothetical protein